MPRIAFAIGHTRCLYCTHPTDDKQQDIELNQGSCVSGNGITQVLCVAAIQAPSEGANECIHLARAPFKATSYLLYNMLLSWPGRYLVHHVWGPSVLSHIHLLYIHVLSTLGMSFSPSVLYQNLTSSDFATHVLGVSN